MMRFWLVTAWANYMFLSQLDSVTTMQPLFSDFVLCPIEPNICFHLPELYFLISFCIGSDSMYNFTCAGSAPQFVFQFLAVSDPALHMFLPISCCVRSDPTYVVNLCCLACCAKNVFRMPTWVKSEIHKYVLVSLCIGTDFKCVVQSLNVFLIFSRRMVQKSVVVL